MAGFAILLASLADACLPVAAQPAESGAFAAGEMLTIEAPAPRGFRVRSGDGKRRGVVPADRCLLSVRSPHAKVEASDFAEDVTFELDGDGKPDRLWIALAGEKRPTLVLTTGAGRSWFLEPSAAADLGLGERNALELQAVRAVEAVGGPPAEIVVTGGFPVEGGSRSSQTVYRATGDRLEPVFSAETFALLMYAGYERCASLRFEDGAIDVRSVVFEGKDAPEVVDQRLSARTERFAWNEKARRFVADPGATKQGPVRARTRHAVALRSAPEGGAGPRLPAGAAVDVVRWRTSDYLDEATWDGRKGMPLEVRTADGKTGWLLTADVKPDDASLCPELFAP